ncbi:hypothetical protein HS125_14855 [bacterium]|nr:hypothetical protein [bacterium]
MLLPALYVWLLEPPVSRRGRLWATSRVTFTFAVWFLGGALLLEGFLRLRPDFVAGPVRVFLPAFGDYLTQGRARARFPDPVLGYRLDPDFQYFQPTTACDGDLYHLGHAFPTDWELENLDRTPSPELVLDARGFRGLSGRGDRRLLFLGDSFVDNWRYPLADNWCNRVGAALARQVVVMGVGGYGVPQEAIALHQHFSAYRPHGVLHCIFTGNDIYDAQVFTAWRASGLPLWQWEIRDSRPLERSPTLAYAAALFSPFWQRRHEERAARWKTDNLQPFRGVIGGASMTLAFHPIYLRNVAASSAEIMAQPGWPPTVAGLVACRRLCEKHGARYGLVILPSKADVYLPHILDQVDGLALLRAAEAPPYTPGHAHRFKEAVKSHRNGTAAAVAAWAKEAGVPVYDLSPAFFAAADEGKQTYLSFDTHWNDAGHRLAAETLASLLAADGW